MRRATLPAACGRPMRVIEPTEPARSLDTPRRRPTPTRSANLAALVTLAALVALVSGCTLSPVALDGPIAVNLHIRASADMVEVDAPGWFAPTSSIYICAAEPPPLPEPGPERDGWTPGPGCHAYGTHPSKDGLAVDLPLADLGARERPAFAAASDWTLLLLSVEGDRVTSAVRSQFRRPNGFAVS